MKGFTLIELLVVFSFIGILTSLGIASYSSYNSQQIVHSNAANVQTELEAAKSKAISQVIPSSCGTNPLTGYEVDFAVNGQQYTDYAVCGTKIAVSTNELPPQVTFATGSSSSIFFNVATGSVNTAAGVIVDGYGKQTTISVNTSGVITSQ